jgi:hypothetical protein
MERARESAAEVSVDELRARIEAWRRSRAKRGPMPAELWADAVVLAKRESVYRTARALGVNYATLKWHVAVASSGGREESTGPVGFVELLAAPRPTEPAGASSTVVELSDASGATMTVRMPSSGGLDLSALVGVFLRGGA